MHGGSSAPAAGLQPETAPAPAPEREKPARERLLVFVASFLLAVLPVHAALFDPSRVFFGVDSASVQLPWSRALAGPLESPRNPGLADQATFFYPVYRWIARSVEAGDPPLWCPLIYAGVPGLANQQSGVLDPQVGLLVLFHALGGVELFDWGLALVATLRIFLALSGAYFLARRLGLAPSGAALAGITFGFSGFLLLWLNHALGHVAPFLPWTLYFLEGTRRERPLLSAVLAALSLLLAILGGHIETAFFVGAAAGVWSLGLLRRSRRAGLLSLGALLLGTAMAAVALVPFWEYLELSAAKYVRELRSLEARSAVDWIALGLSIALVGIVVSYRRALSGNARRGVLVASAGIVLAFAGVVLVLGARDQGSFAALALVPDLLGHPRTGGYRGAGDYLEAASGWIAFPALLLALAGILSPKGPLVRRGLVAAIGVIAFLLSVELPGLLEVYRHVPLIGLGATVRLAVVGSLFLGLLAGEALESAPRAAKASAAAILAFGLASLLWPRAPERYTGGLAREPDGNELFGVVLGLERIATLRSDGCFEGWLAPEVAFSRAQLVLERVEADGSPVAEPAHVIALELHRESSELARSEAVGDVRAAPAGARWFRTPYADLGKLPAGHWTARVELIGADGTTIAKRHAGVATLERTIDRDPATLAFLAAGVLVLLVARRGGRWIVSAVALAQALHFAQDLNPAVPREQVFPPTRTEEILRDVLAGPAGRSGAPASSIGPWRFFGDAGVLPPNTGLVRGLPGIEGYDALDVAAFNFYRENVLPSGVNPLLAWNARGVELDNPAFRLYGIGALVLAAPLEHPGWELVASPVETDPARTAETWIYRAREPLPRAFCVPRVVSLDELAELWRRDRALFRPLEIACLQEDWRPERPFTSAKVSTPLITNNEVRVEAELDGEGLLIVTDQVFPGWTVTVDGEERPVLTADMIFRGVALDAGTHDVVFRYRPHTLRAGAWISLTAGIALLGLLAAGLLSRPGALQEPGR